VKLYFMIGLPTETDEDVLAIAETGREVAAMGRQELGSKKGRLRIPVTIAGFVPKPHSVFESVRQCSRQELAYKQGLLREALRDKCVDLKFGAVEQTALEGILARGGRWLAPAIAAVANQGEGLEVWGEWQSLARWEAALAELGTSLDEEVGHEVREVATSPWGHIDVGVSWEFRARERERALAGQPTPDCRESRCHQCGLQKHCQKSATPIPLRLQNKGGKCRRSPRNASEQSGPACQAIITFAKREKVRWLAHLDLSRAFQRAFRRAGLPVAYTLGFHQRPRMTIARPLPVGATGEAELLAIDLIEVWPAERIAKALAATLPQGLALREVVVQQKENRSPFARLVRACYEISLEGPSTTQLAAALTKVLETSTIEVKRRTKRGQQTVDIRAGLLEAEVVEQPLGLRFLLACSDAYLVKPDEVIEVVNRYLCDTGSPPVAVVHMHRRCLVMDDDHSLDRREAELSRIAHA
ncbi:MAG: TIGR03936 family radical SAM-associated protein, partial [Candidatus Zipacnadales bacterium]